MIEDKIELAARALCTLKGVSGDSLYQHHVWEDYPTDFIQEYNDWHSGEPRQCLMHYAWRNQFKYVEAVFEAIGYEL